MSPVCLDTSVAAIPPRRAYFTPGSDADFVTHVDEVMADAPRRAATGKPAHGPRWVVGPTMQRSDESDDDLDDSDAPILHDLLPAKTGAAGRLVAVVVLVLLTLAALALMYFRLPMLN